jgi:hypothetical protein
MVRIAGGAGCPFWNDRCAWSVGRIGTVRTVTARYGHPIWVIFDDGQIMDFDVSELERLSGGADGAGGGDTDGKAVPACPIGVPR